MKFWFHSAMWHILSILFVVQITKATPDDLYVLMSGDSSVVIGGTAHVKASVYDSAGWPASGSFKFTWNDNAIPQHNFYEDVERSVSYFNVSYPPEIYAPGPYNLQVSVKHGWLWPREISHRFDLNVTMFLSGDMSVVQGIARKRYIATNASATHQISVVDADYQFISTAKNQLRTYWFVDCMYMGVTDNLSKTWNYTKPGMTHYVEALVVASYIPPPRPTTTTTTTTTTSTTPSTTTTSSTTTTIKPPTTVLPSTTTAAPLNTTAKPTEAVTTPEPDPWEVWLATYPVYNKSLNSPANGFCINTSSIPMGLNSSYGYFNKKIATKAPVRIVGINGSNWLQNGDILNMSIACNGSGPFTYCIQLVQGLYNVTGNETCTQSNPLPDCQVRLRHFFKEPAQYTMVVIISNMVSKLVTPIGVNVYQITKQPQLSVIVVPVTFSIVAFILIIFGVAWYVQSRRSFTVEVADFDFGHQSNDMEYKTFRERLRESVINSFFRTNEPTDTEPAWSPSRKYGSMQ